MKLLFNVNASVDCENILPVVTILIFMGSWTLRKDLVYEVQTDLFLDYLINVFLPVL